MHDCAPYFVGGETYYGGNRLIWLWDIALIGRSISEIEWREFCRLAQSKQVARICRDGLVAASDRVGPVAPEWVESALMSKSSRYFSGGQLRRAWLDWWAVRGIGRKLRYLTARAFPSAGFMRAKYRALEHRPLPSLYLRRLAELARPRR
ncbi:hypothetical protein GCM10023325_11540 [Sphingomonas lutea]